MGSTSPQGHLLPLVRGRQRACRLRAHEEGATWCVVDTSGMVSGIWGQLVKYYKVDLLEPDLVVGLQRGEELEPVLGVIERFFGVDVVLARRCTPTSCPPASSSGWSSASGPWRATSASELQRFRVKPTVFMPTLPPLFDLAQLDRLLVGLSDGTGGVHGRSATSSTCPRTRGCG